MKDLKFTKDQVTCDFEEAENLENIQSGESIGTLFGKIKKWFSEIKDCVKKDDLQSQLKAATNRAVREANDTGVGRFWREPQGPYYGEIFGNYEENKATREYSHAEGDQTTASGYGGSHSEGIRTEASNFAAHAEGNSSIASGLESHAEGYYTEASGEHAHSEGEHTIAASANQHVQGKYNIEDADSKYAMIIGNGTSDTARSNALTLDWDGNLWTAGDVTATDSGGNNVSLCEVKTLLENILERVEKLEEKAITEITTEKIDEIMEG